MEDFTGGVTDTVNLQENVPKDLFTVMCKGFERKTLMGCAVEVSNLWATSQPSVNRPTFRYHRTYVLACGPVVLAPPPLQ